MGGDDYTAGGNIDYSELSNGIVGTGNHLEGKKTQEVVKSAGRPRKTGDD